jgi:hypothetical protein
MSGLRNSCSACNACVACRACRWPRLSAHRYNRGVQVRGIRHGAAPSTWFIAEDAGLHKLFAERARAGARVRLLFGDPDSPNVAAAADRNCAASVTNRIADLAHAGAASPASIVSLMHTRPYIAAQRSLVREWERSVLCPTLLVLRRSWQLDSVRTIWCGSTRVHRSLCGLRARGTPLSPCLKCHLSLSSSTSL